MNDKVSPLRHPDPPQPDTGPQRLTFGMHRVCTTCRGTGRLGRSDNQVDCLHCRGKGFIPNARV